jgi:hypothetical protein
MAMYAKQNIYNLEFKADVTLLTNSTRECSKPVSESCASGPFGRFNWFMAYATSHVLNRTITPTVRKLKAAIRMPRRRCTEPRRLWKRYLTNNPLFVYNLVLQSLGLKDFDARPAAE